MKIVKATLIKKNTADGLFEVWEDVPIGKEYRVDRDSVKDYTFWHILKKVQHTKPCVIAMPEDEEEIGMLFPTELLQIEE